MSALLVDEYEFCSTGDWENGTIITITFYQLEICHLSIQVYFIALPRILLTIQYGVEKPHLLSLDTKMYSCHTTLDSKFTHVEHIP